MEDAWWHSVYTAEYSKIVIIFIVLLRQCFLFFCTVAICCLTSSLLLLISEWQLCTLLWLSMVGLDWSSFCLWLFTLVSYKKYWLTSCSNDMQVCVGSLQVGQCFFHKLLFHVTLKPEIQILDMLKLIFFCFSLFYFFTSWFFSTRYSIVSYQVYPKTDSDLNLIQLKNINQLKNKIT